MSDPICNLTLRGELANQFLLLICLNQFSIEIVWIALGKLWDGIHAGFFQKVRVFLSYTFDPIQVSMIDPFQNEFSIDACLLSKLFTPFRIGDLELPNRVVVPPMVQCRPILSAEGLAWYRRLARGGAGMIIVEATGVPPGLGEPVYDKLDADIAYAMMGINAVKGVEIGAGFACVAQRGSEHGDELTPQGFVGNHAGGVLGGISTGQPIRVSLAIKPTSSIRVPRRSIDLEGKPTMVETFGRHDPCVGIRAAPIAEAMLALVLMDHALRHRAQNGDVSVPLAPIPGVAPDGA